MTADRFNFRAYIKKLNKVYDVYCLDYSTGKLRIKCCDKDGEMIINDVRNEAFNEFFDEEEFILMQSTGFIDKNGKEIYEGDIIKILNFEIEEDQLNIMKFYNGGFKAMSVWGKTDIDKARRDIFNTNPSHNENWNIEVIGNIYENKELLGE